MSTSARTRRHIQVLQVPDCPLVDRLLSLVTECQQLGIDVDMQAIVGEFPSPTLVVDGLDVATGELVTGGVRCRLDLPSRDQVLAALRM